MKSAGGSSYIKLDVKVILHGTIRRNIGDAPDELHVQKTDEREINGVTWLYYAVMRPYRIIIVMKDGTPLESIPRGSVLRGSISFETRDLLAALDINAGKVHLRIDVDGVVPPEEAEKIPEFDMRLMSKIMETAPRADRPGGARGVVGRKRIGGVGVRSLSVAMPDHYWEYVKKLGNGERSRGVRKAVEVAIEKYKEELGGSA